MKTQAHPSKPRREASALSFGVTKEAALYYEKVIPFFVSYEAVDDVLKRAPREWKALNSAFAQLDRATGELVDTILPKHLIESEEFIAGWRRLELFCTILRFKKGIDQYGLNDDPKFLHEIGISADEYRDLQGEFARQLESLASRFDFRGLPVMAPDLFVHDGSAEDDVVMAIRGIELVDSSQATWEQIVEFRKDPDACNRLRRLRVFAVENYSGRSAAFIEDDLLLRIEQYQETVRRWGFTTMYATMGTLLSSKTLGAAFGATFVSILAGAPTLAAISAGGGAAIEIGQVILEVSRRRFELRNLLSDNPVSYLAEVKNRISG